MRTHVETPPRLPSRLDEGHLTPASRLRRLTYSSPADELLTSPETAPRTLRLSFLPESQSSLTASSNDCSLTGCPCAWGPSKAVGAKPVWPTSSLGLYHVRILLNSLIVPVAFCRLFGIFYMDDRAAANKGDFISFFSVYVFSFFFLSYCTG